MNWSNAVSFFVGLLFAVGLVVSGMTQPQKVIGFLDILGDWDPSLIFVMVGAISVHAIAYRFVGKKKSPLFADTFRIPTRRDIDKKLIMGSGLFGIGWGLGGFCPGPGIVAAAGFSGLPLVFVFSMLTGMLAYKVLSNYVVNRPKS